MYRTEEVDELGSYQKEFEWFQSVLVNHMGDTRLERIMTMPTCNKNDRSGIILLGQM